MVSNTSFVIIWPLKLGFICHRLFVNDPDNYKDPTEFRPERFLGTESFSPERDPYDLVFGFGRRKCPGRIIADVELFLVIATCLAVFDIRTPTGESGRGTKETYEFSATGLLKYVMMSFELALDDNFCS